MKCLNPRKIFNKSLGRSLWTACGRCSNCLENRREQWLFRLDCELSYSTCGYHCTLQYDNVHLGDNVLDKKHVQLLFKKLRNKGLSFSYYGIGEYGTKDHRKHFHVAFFLKQPFSMEDFRLLLNDTWEYGFVYCTKLCHRNMAYVLHYHTRPKIVDDKPTMQFFSKGLGSDFLDDEVWSSYFISSRNFSVRSFKGKTIPFPRYYRKKLGLEFGLDNFTSVKTILNVIADYHHKPVFELTKSEIDNYLRYLNERDVKHLDKYNNQKKGV